MAETLYEVTFFILGTLILAGMLFFVISIYFLIYEFLDVIYAKIIRLFSKEDTDEMGRYIDRQFKNSRRKHSP